MFQDGSHVRLYHLSCVYIAAQSQYSHYTAMQYKRCVFDEITFLSAVVYLNFRPGSTFLVPVRTVSPGHWVNKADTQ